MHLFGDPFIWLPFVFAMLMGISILVYVVLDGFDLGVGLLFPFATPSERDRMVASIGPFWDANETWLVLGGAGLLAAFPLAYSVILSAFYLPVYAGFVVPTVLALVSGDALRGGVPILVLGGVGLLLGLVLLGPGRSALRAAGATTATPLAPVLAPVDGTDR